MRIYVSGSQQGYFATHKTLELTDLIEKINYPLLFVAVNQAIAERLTLPLDSYFARNPSPFLKTRDLWRTSPFIKNILYSKEIAQVAKQLVEASPLRLAFADLISHPMTHKTFFEAVKNKPLKEWASLQGEFIGALISIDQEKTSVQMVDKEFIFTEEFKEKLKNTITFLLVYVDISGRYVKNVLDPLTSHFKQCGYNQGDKFNDTLNPVVVR